jgi:acetolactate synthase-1/3 small subunit
VTRGSEQVVEQILKQLNKLIDVVKVTDLSDFQNIEREMMLIKLEAKQTDSITTIKQIADVFRGKIIDLTHKTFTIEISGNSDKLDAFIEAMNEQTILEVVRSGCIGIARGSVYLKA